MQRCTDEYVRNECEPNTRIAALDKYCSEREICMSTPINQRVGSVSTVLTMLADLLNEFSGKLTIQS